MDFYGFSNGVEQANALNFGSALANNSYNSINTGFLGSYDAKKVKKDQVGIETDQTNLNMANKQTLTDEITQGGGTVVGIGGIGAVGKSIRDVGNQLGKATRIAEQHLKLATASGDASEISKAQSLLDVVNKGDLKSFVRLTGKFANQRAVTTALGTNMNRAVRLASDINSGSGFGPAASSVSTGAGRTANTQIVARASEIAEEQSAPEEAVSAVVGAPSSAEAIALGTPAQQVASVLRSSSVDSRNTFGGGRAAYEVRQAERAARRANLVEESTGNMVSDIYGTAARPDTRRQVNRAEIEEGADYEDAADELSGFGDQAETVLARGSGNVGGSVATGTSNVISDLGARTGGNALRRGTETLGQRGIAATFRSAFGRELDLQTPDGLQDVDENEVALGRVGTGWVGGGISERGLGSRQLDGIESSTQAPVREEPVPEEAPVEPPALEEEVADAPREQVPSAPVEQAPVIEQASAPQAERVAEQPLSSVVDRAVVSSVPKSTGTSVAANLLGSSEHADAIAGGGVDEVGIKAISSLGGFSGSVGGAALKTVSAIGRGAKLLGPIANAGFLIDQTYEEVKAANPFGKTHSLEGVGGWEKAGNLLKEAGDFTATVGSGLALAGPVTFGVSDVAALGVELGGGALALAGDLMDDYGKAKEDTKSTSTSTAQLAKDKAQQLADATASNVAIQNAAASGNRNLSGRGAIAQVSQSAVRNY